MFPPGGEVERPPLFLFADYFHKITKIVGIALDFYFGIVYNDNSGARETKPNQRGAEMKLDIDALLVSTDEKTGTPSVFADWDEARKMYAELGWESDPADDGIMTIRDYADEQRRLGGFCDAESFADHILRFAAGSIDLDRAELIAALAD